MLLNGLQHLISGLGKVLGTLKSSNPAVRAPLGISLGAIAGAISRYYITLLFAQWLGASFPYGTLIVNISGALLMGFFTTLALERTVSADIRLLVAVGFLGSYTTFSTYALDTDTLIWKGRESAALVYWTGSAILGVLGLEFGSFLARRLL